MDQKCECKKRKRPQQKVSTAELVTSGPDLSYGSSPFSAAVMETLRRATEKVFSAHSF